MKPGVLLLTLLFHNEEMGGHVSQDAHGFIPRPLPACSKLWWPMGTQSHTGARKRLSALHLPPQKCPTLLGTAPRLSYLGELGIVHNIPDTLVRDKPRRDKLTQPQTGKAPPTALHTDVSPPTAQQTLAEGRVSVLAAVRQVGHPAVKVKGVR